MKFGVGGGFAGVQVSKSELNKIKSNNAPSDCSAGNQDY
jgi:hypothetical protein